jgi:hypothetical protein
MTDRAPPSATTVADCREDGSLPQRGYWLLSLAIASLALLAAFTRPDPSSIWRHFSTGRVILDQGLPRTDHFTVFGSDRSWPNPAWLFDVVAFFCVTLGDTWGVFLLRVLITTVLSIALIATPRAMPALARALPIPLAIVAMSDALVLSPALGGLLCLALLSGMVLQGHASGRRRWSWLLATFAVQAIWANIDTHFMLGPTLVLAMWIGALVDRWLDGTAAAESRANAARAPADHGSRSCGELGVALVVCLVASMASPYGWGGWRASWFECSAAFGIGASGQELVSGLVPLWSIESDAWILASWALVLLILAALLMAGLRKQYCTLVPASIVATLAMADVRLSAFAAVWLTRHIQFSLASIKSDWLDRSPSASAGGSRPRAVAIMVFLWTGIFAIPFLKDAGRHVERVRRELSGASAVAARVRWLRAGKMDGSVVVLDPSDAGWLVWGDSRLRPLLDDRVELFGSGFGAYRALCRDIVDDRQNAYRRTDGTVGGWRPAYNALGFRWVVSRAGDVAANENLCSGTFWGPAYWDSDVVIMGMKQHPEVIAASRRLTELDGLLRGRSNDVPMTTGADLDRLMPSSTLVRDQSPEELLRLAQVMVALHYPSIAMSYLARIDSPVWNGERDRWMGFCKRSEADGGAWRLPARAAADQVTND